MQTVGGPIGGTGNTQFPFSEIIDHRTGLAFISADALDDFLCDNLGSLLPIVPSQGIEAFFLVPSGEIGIGAGWADNGIIGETPVLLYSKATQERASFMFYALKRVLFPNINPQIAFAIYSIGAPSGGAEDVRWQLEVRYIAQNESPTKVADETLLFTQTLPNFTANTRQTELIFTLDKSKIVDQDVLSFSLSRLQGDVLDTYAGDVAVGQSGLIAETLTHNP